MIFVRAARCSAMSDWGQKAKSAEIVDTSALPDSDRQSARGGTSTRTLAEALGASAQPSSAKGTV